MRYLPQLLFIAAFSGGPAVAAPIIFSDAGPAATDIQDTVDAFRNEFSGLNPFTPTNEDPDGRREINWDGVPDTLADPNELPGDFFNADVPGRARGIEFVATGDTEGFEVSSSSASGVPILFDEPDEYSFFSPERIFRPIDGSTFDILFFDPSDQTTPALTKGFGAVFTGVEEVDQVTLPELLRVGTAQRIMRIAARRRSAGRINALSVTRNRRKAICGGCQPACQSG